MEVEQTNFVTHLIKRLSCFNCVIDVFDCQGKKNERLSFLVFFYRNHCLPFEYRHALLL